MLSIFLILKTSVLPTSERVCTWDQINFINSLAKDKKSLKLVKMHRKWVSIQISRGVNSWRRYFFTASAPSFTSSCPEPRKHETHTKALSLSSSTSVRALNFPIFKSSLLKVQRWPGILLHSKKKHIYFYSRTDIKSDKTSKAVEQWELS